MKRLTTLLAASLAAFAAYAQTAELLQHYTTDDVNTVVSDFNLPLELVAPQFEVDIYRISYETTHPNGETWPVTGALALPSGITCPLPLSSYQHGTIARKTDAPSYLSDEALLGVLYASVGFACVLPDYIGLGDSPGLHLYVHAESEALASLDLIRAAHTLQNELNFALNDQLFIWGYSQGGHATMALHKLIEEEHADEFTVTASAPMSGPYDISGVQAEVITSDQPYPTPGYLPYVVLSYQEVYGNLYTDLSEVFLPEYAAIIPDLFDGTNSMGYINNQFPDVPSQALLPEVLEAYENDPEHPIRIALQANDLYDWAPQAPVRLYYCEGDDQVSYLNSIVCLDAMVANGATDVLAFNGGNLDHGGCAPLAMFAGFNYFNALKEDSFGLDVSIEAFGTPAAGTALGYINVFIPSEEFYTFSWSNGAETLNIESLAEGEYTLTITNAEGCSRSYTVEIGVSVGVHDQSEAAFQLYPMPANDVVQLGAHNFNAVEVFGLNGRMVLQGSVRGQSTLNVRELAPGGYILVLDGWKTERLLIVR
jgi:pimeloyl-ACP methyl ester carboxylesterase